MQRPQRARPDYGLDSPAIVAGEFVAGILILALSAIATRFPRPVGLPLTIVGIVVGAYFIVGAGSMIYYSKVAKLRMREQFLDLIHWHGDELALDVGCGPGVLLVGVAHRVKTGKVVGIDLWKHGAISANQPAVALRNAAIEGVADRVSVQEGDARRLPFSDASCDVVVSSFVLHEMDTSADRDQMLREIARVLKPGGQVALLDFIFTAEAAHTLRRYGVADARRVRIGHWYFWLSLITSVGLVRLFAVTGSVQAAVAGA